MLWIKEVEMVDSLDELISSRSVSGKNFPNFEMLDAKIAPALNKIVHNSQFEKVCLEEQKAQKEDRFLRGRQTAFMIYDCFLVTGAHDTLLCCADFFSVTPRDGNVQEFDTRWDEVLLSMSKIPSDDILESLYKMRVGATQNRIGIQQKPKNKIKIGNATKCKEINRMSCRNSGRIWLMKVLQQSHGKPCAYGSRHFQFVSPMEPRAHVEPGSGKHSVFYALSEGPKL